VEVIVDMVEMIDMPLPENTLPMMAGKGQFGPVERGGMFTTLKVRKDMVNDYTDQGRFAFPKGTVAHALDSGADLLNIKQYLLLVESQTLSLMRETRIKCRMINRKQVKITG
jgi:hypothetical protein